MVKWSGASYESLATSRARDILEKVLSPHAPGAGRLFASYNSSLDLQCKISFAEHVLKRETAGCVPNFGLPTNHSLLQLHVHVKFIPMMARASVHCNNAVHRYHVRNVKTWSITFCITYLQATMKYRSPGLWELLLQEPLYWATPLPFVST